MTPRRWLLVVVLGGAAILALSFVGGWIVHDRELRGEGYRHVVTHVSAWRGVGLPVLALGVAGAAATGAWAAVVLADAARPRWPLVGGAAAVLGVLLATAVPLGQDAHASSVDLSPGILLAMGVPLAALMLAAALAAAGAGRGVLLTAGGIGVVALLAATGGRWMGLQAGEGSGRHWSEGSYTRAVTGDEGTETLTIGDGTFTIADRWHGTWEWSGWTVILDADPACPDSRGTYHAHGVADEDLRFVKVVDTCDDGARAADLETGIWERDP